jgi:hypothetical protein
LAWCTDIANGTEYPILDADLNKYREAGGSELDHEGGAWWNFEIVSEFEILSKHLRGIQGFYAVAFEDLTNGLEKVFGHLLWPYHVGNRVTRQQRPRNYLCKNIQ